MRCRKVDRLAPYARELDAAGVDHRPIAFTCFGRPHPQAKQLVSSLARRVARRKGTEAHVEERRIWCRISTEIWRRAARMIRRCLPSHAQEVADEDDAYHDPDVELRRGHSGSVDPSPAGSAPAAAPSG